MKKLGLLLAFLSVFFALPAVADSVASFKGKVTDATTQQPLAGATVYISDLKATTVTNANGEFHFVLDKNISNTNALLQVLDDETNDYKIILNNPTSILMEKDEPEEIYINPNFVNQIEERLISCQIFLRRNLQRSNLVILNLVLRSNQSNN